MATAERKRINLLFPLKSLCSEVMLAMCLDRAKRIYRLSIVAQRQLSYRSRKNKLDFQTISRDEQNSTGMDKVTCAKTSQEKVDFFCTQSVQFPLKKMSQSQ